MTITISDSLYIHPCHILTAWKSHTKTLKDVETLPTKQAATNPSQLLHGFFQYRGVCAANVRLGVPAKQQPTFLLLPLLDLITLSVRISKVHCLYTVKNYHALRPQKPQWQNLKAWDINSEKPFDF